MIQIIRNLCWNSSCQRSRRHDPLHRPFSEIIIDWLILFGPLFFIFDSPIVILRLISSFLFSSGTTLRLLTLYSLLAFSNVLTYFCIFWDCPANFEQRVVCLAGYHSVPIFMENRNNWLQSKIVVYWGNLVVVIEMRLLLEQIEEGMQINLR